MGNILKENDWEFPSISESITMTWNPETINQINTMNKIKAISWGEIFERIPWN